MIIRVYDGEFDASKFSVITPVIPVDKDEEGNPLIKPYFVIQITCDGTRTTLRYDTIELAERERNFMLVHWLKTKKQEGIIIMRDEDEGAVDESNKSGAKKSKKD